MPPTPESVILRACSAPCSAKSRIPSDRFVLLAMKKPPLVVWLFAVFRTARTRSVASGLEYQRRSGWLRTFLRLIGKPAREFRNILSSLRLFLRQHPRIFIGH